MINLPSYTDEFIIRIEQVKVRYRHLINIIPDQFKKNFINYFQSSLPINFINKLLRDNSGNVVKFVPKFFMNSVITMISTFFFIKDKVVIEQYLIKFIPTKLLSTIKHLRKGCLQGLITYAKSEIILMSITALICTIGYSIVQHPYALFLALITGFIDSLPILGTGFIIWPWTAYCFLSSNYTHAIVLIITYGVAVITRNILSPKLIGKQIGVHPLVMLMSIYIGIKALGILGIVIGPIIIITAKIIKQDTTR
jgi:sporulation integral membrane protein YtvI